jgi:hypothetical protein
MKIGDLIAGCRACAYAAPPGPEDAWTSQQIIDHAVSKAVADAAFVRAIIVVGASYPLSKIVIKLLLSSFIERFSQP